MICIFSWKPAVVAASCCLVAFAGYSQVSCNEIFISEVLEGSGNNRGIEFFNPTNVPIDLSAYSIQRWGNGEGTATDWTQLTGTIPALGTWVLINGQTEDVDLGGGAVSPAVLPEMQEYADQLDNPYPAPTYANGNDALVLVKNNSTVVDIFGKPGENPGLAWTDDAANGFVDVGDGATLLTRNHTLRRKYDVTGGVTVPPTVFDTFAEYDTLPMNTWDGLGQHACICGSTTTPTFQTSCDYLGDSGWADIETGIYTVSELMYPLGASISEDVVLHVSEVLIDPTTASAFAVMSWEDLTISGMPNGLSFDNFPSAVGGNNQLCITYSGAPLELGTFDVEVSGEMVLDFFGSPYPIGTVSSTITIIIEPNTNPIPGCTYDFAANFNPLASVDDGSCVLEGSGNSGCELVYDGNGDGSVGSGDLLGLLAEFGEDCTPNTAFSCGNLLEYQGYDYQTVLIGEQCWFAENLRSENYENGDAIPAGLSNSDWQNTTSGAVAVFGEGSSPCYDYSPDGDACDEAWSLNEYGRLYNWYAVDDARGLCPSGWHVPTDEEWTVMTDHLGGESIAGDKMKTTYGWYNEGNGTNSSGFSGLPGGYRNGALSQIFDEAGGGGLWLSSSPKDDFNAWARALGWSCNCIYRDFYDVEHGFSVRCVRDAE